MITVHYRCACFAPGRERLLDVPERGAEEDVLTWMTNVQRVCTEDHKTVSPLCFHDKMEHVKVPNEEGVRIGANPTQH